VGRSHGIDAAKLRDVAAWERSSRFDEMERLVLGYADGMASTPAGVPDGIFDELRARFTPEQLVELTTALAWENFRARWNRALLVESDCLGGEGCVLQGPA